MILQGDALDVLKRLESNSIHMAVTSPPYFNGLRTYDSPMIYGGLPECQHEWGNKIPGDPKGGSGTPTNKNNRGEKYARGDSRGRFCKKCTAWEGELGREPSPDLYCHHLVEISRELRRVLRHDGTFWLNIGDSRAGSGRGPSGKTGCIQNQEERQGFDNGGHYIPSGFKRKDIFGIPFRVGFALQEDGWYFRACIPWLKRSGMPGSYKDRPVSTIEFVLMLTKTPKNYYDHVAVMQEASTSYQKDKRPKEVLRQRCIKQFAQFLQSGRQILRGVLSGSNSFADEVDGFVDRCRFAQVHALDDHAGRIVCRMNDEVVNYEIPV
jgi:DNA modification methylase